MFQIVAEARGKAERRTEAARAAVVRKGRGKCSVAVDGSEARAARAVDRYICFVVGACRTEDRGGMNTSNVPSACVCLCICVGDGGAQWYGPVPAKPPK